MTGYQARFEPETFLLQVSSFTTSANITANVFTIYVLRETVPEYLPTFSILKIRHKVCDRKKVEILQAS